ncbi:MAG TPA: hypothetical protein VGD65_06525 [Chryseosolibacter sp.]
MLRFIERIGELLLSPQERALDLRELRVQFIKNRKAILHHLKLCKKSKGIVGLYATRLGKGMFIGTVTSLYHDVITLRPVGDESEAMKTIMLPINEITSICPFNQIYTEPEEELDALTQEQHEEELRLAHAN